ncbi:helix-turn-helix transcriptional regulator [Archangium violaceum]|uniref:helix-turn-helix domain-containing protein n=1 Tax=Archangium violaceum TaxID=83451 RepID=UPI002B2A2A1D|nr:helix-turn-helix transcriptional regulator [Archangium violaceum]
MHGERMLMCSRKRTIPGLGERLVSLRQSRGLSQQVLATRAGISIPRLRDAERFGAATTETLNLLAQALATDVDTLVGRKEGAR